jgi:hypothetical protein
MNRTFPAAAMTAAALLLLVGCTGDAELDTAATAATAEDESTGQSQDAPGDDGQSVEDACAVIAQTITDATAEFDGGDADDLAAVAEAMEAAAAELATEAGAITNDEVAALVPDLQQMFAEAGEVFVGLGEGDASGVEDLEEIGTRFQETGAAFEELCAG